MWNLVGEAANELVARDRADLGPLFHDNVQIGTRDAPKCDVLFLYCALDASGRVSGQPFSMRDAIKAAGARIAVLASEIPAESMPDSDLSAGSDWRANIVITLDRNGEHFGRFFKELFSQMQAGVSMLMAWVELAPQGPVQGNDLPVTICLPEAGHIAFGPRSA
jgi:hypothetical protein